MNLTSLFNFAYLKQNLKKSKNILALFIGIVPIFNLITLIMQIESGTSTIPSLENLSIINMLGLYVIPVVLSICLFGYIFKKRTVDFVNSMPISRKSIFITNTIGGIAIIVLINLLNIILLAILGSIFTNLFIPITLLVDYFIVWTISYIFVFTACNIAMSLSGNAITGIVLTMLILFLIPFLNTYKNIKSSYLSNDEVRIECLEESCKPINYTCYEGDTNCLKDEANNIYEANVSVSLDNDEYTLPYNIINRVLFNTDNSMTIYNTKENIIMLVLSIIYIIIGCLTFERRKMEVSETSFKSIHTHLFVKSLTLIPILLLTYEIVSRYPFDISTIFIFAIVLVYFFLYDLITKKSINHIKLSLLYFIITTCIIFTFAFAITKLVENNNNKYLTTDDIKSVTIIPDEINNIYNYEDTLIDLAITDKNIINKVVSFITDSSNADYYYQDNEDSKYITIYLNSTSGRLDYRGIVDNATYNELIDLLINNKTIQNSYNKINFNEIFALQIGNTIYEVDEQKDVLKEIKESLNNTSINTTIETPLEESLPLYIYSYQDHKLNIYHINSTISKELESIIIKAYNQDLYQNIDNNFSISCGNTICYNNINSDIISYVENDIISYIINHQEEVDPNQDYLILDLYKVNSFNLSGNYKYITNNIEDITNIVKTKEDELRQNPDNSYLFETEEIYE